MSALPPIADIRQRIEHVLCAKNGRAANRLALDPVTACRGEPRGRGFGEGNLAQRVEDRVRLQQGRSAISPR